MVWEKIAEKINFKFSKDEFMKSLSSGDSELFSALDLLPEAIKIIDNEYNLLWANHSLIEIYDKNIIGKKCYEVFHNSDTNCEGCVSKKAIELKKPYEGEVKAYDIDGNELFFSTFTKPLIMGENGIPEILIEINKDITDKKSNETKYGALFNESSDGIFIYDLDTNNIIDSNNSFLELYGYEKNELIGKSCFILTAELDKTNEAKKKINKDGKLKVAIRHHKKKDGTVFPVELNAYTLKVDNKNLGFTFIKDLTEQKEIEKSLIESEYKYKALFNKWHSIKLK